MIMLAIMLMQIMMGGERLAAWEQVVVVAINYRVRNTYLWGKPVAHHNKNI